MCCKHSPFQRLNGKFQRAKEKFQRRDKKFQRPHEGVHQIERSTSIERPNASTEVPTGKGRVPPSRRSSSQTEVPTAAWTCRRATHAQAMCAPKASRLTSGCMTGLADGGEEVFVQTDWPMLTTTSHFVKLDWTTLEALLDLALL